MVNEPGITVPGAVSNPAEGVVPRPELLATLEEAARVTVISAPAGSGKTVLVKSWIREAGLDDSAAYVLVPPDERNAQRFWLCVLDALRSTSAGSELVGELTPAPRLQVEETLEQLVEDLEPLEEPVWLVVDDLHELASGEALRQLELLLMRAPAAVRFILLTREDVNLGLHRLRLTGGLTELRADDLRFTLDEARALFHAVRVELPDTALCALHERTEGWAAGLRLAALSLAGHRDPEQFAAEFSGSERTVAEYLIAEVLDRQPPEVRQLLLRTSILERVNGPLADALTEGRGAERILHNLEQAGAFVVSLDSQSYWFRYHQLFADLLQLELRRTEPEAVRRLHGVAAEWYAEHEYPAEAIHHALAAERWDLGARLLAEYWLRLFLVGQDTTVHEFLQRFPDDALKSYAELAAVNAALELQHGSIGAAESSLQVATQRAQLVPTDGLQTLDIMLSLLRGWIARLRGDAATALECARPFLATAEDPIPVCERRVNAMLSLGVAEVWGPDPEAADQHLHKTVELASRCGQSWLQIVALGHLAVLASFREWELSFERSSEAIELAARHGWSTQRPVAAAYTVQAWILAWRGQFHEAEQYVERAQRVFRLEVEPVTGATLELVRGMLAVARGSGEEALRSFKAAERLTGPLVPAHRMRFQVRALELHALARLCEPASEDIAAAAVADAYVDPTDILTGPAVAALKLSRGDAEGAAAVLAPALEQTDSAEAIWAVTAFVVAARVWETVGDADAASRALESALDRAEPSGVLWPFLLHSAPELLEQHRRQHTSHAALISTILDLLIRSAPSSPGESERLIEPLSEAELRVMRYLPTNLSQREIARELYVSVHTIKTHTKHLYAKLGAHGRAEAVERARLHGLLAPSLHRR